MSDFADFDDSLKKGAVGEAIFRQDFLEFLHIKYEDVTGCQAFQIIDTDFLSVVGDKIEVKSNYKDDKILIIEEHSNCDPLYGRVTDGWFEKTKADLIVFVSKDSRVMVFMPMTERLKVFYRAHKHRFRLEKNRVSTKRNKNGTISKWQSSFRRVPFGDLPGFLSVYKKLPEPVVPKVRFHQMSMF